MRAHTTTVVTTRAKRLRRIAKMRPWIQLWGLRLPWAIRTAMTRELKAFEISHSRPKTPTIRPVVTPPVEIDVTPRS